eukprot:scaffold67731_cov84-Attheya_sp.AAC.2
MKWKSKYQDEEEEGGTKNRGVPPVFDTSDRGSKHGVEIFSEGLKHRIVNISGPHRGNNLEIFHEVLEHTIPQSEKLLIADRGISKISLKHDSN